MEALQTAIDTCGEYDAEFRIVLPSGETRWIQGRGRALADDGGAAVRLVGAGYDTTGQRHGDARVARVLEAMNAAFFSLDREWRFTYVNAEAERRAARGPGRSCSAARSGSSSRPRSAATSRSTTAGAAASGQERVFEAYYPAPLDVLVRGAGLAEPGRAVGLLPRHHRAAGRRGARAPGHASACR